MNNYLLRALMGWTCMVLVFGLGALEFSCLL